MLLCPQWEHPDITIQYQNRDTSKKLIFSLWRYVCVKTSVNLIDITTQQWTNQSGERTVELSPPPAIFSKWRQLSKTVDCCRARNIDRSVRWRSTFRSGSMLSKIAWQTYKCVFDQKKFLLIHFSPNFMLLWRCLHYPRLAIMSLWRHVASMIRRNSFTSPGSQWHS